MLRRFGLLLALLTAILPACSSSMRKISVPRQGVTLRYDFTPGATYEGNLRVGSTRAIEGIKENLNQAVDCEVEMVVLGSDAQGGGTLLRATVKDVDLEWALPPTADVSADELHKLASEQLKGMQVTFSVDARGQVTRMPAAPRNAAEALLPVIQAVLDALQSAFLVLPDKALKRGARWTETAGGDRKGKVEGSFGGLYHDEERDEDLARLSIVHGWTRMVDTEEGQHQYEREGETEALFSTKGYLAEAKAESRNFDPTQGMSIHVLRIEWRKTKKGKAAPASGEVQAIEDPCDPDYVGPDPCRDGGE